METSRLKLGAIGLVFGTVDINTILLWIQNFGTNLCTPTKLEKKQNKKHLDFLDGITSQCFELKCWDLVHGLLISFCFGSKNWERIGPP